MRNYIGLVPRYLKKQFKRSILTIVGIVLGVALITAIGIISESINYAMIENLKNTGGDYHAYYDKINLKQIENLKKDTRLDEVGTDLSLGTYDIPNKSTYIKVDGYDLPEYKMINVHLLLGKYPEKENEIALEKWALEEMGLKLELGQVIPLSFKSTYTDNRQIIHSYQGKANFKLVGILDNAMMSKASGVSFGYVAQNTVKNLIPKEFMSYKAFVKVKDNLPIRRTIEEKQKDIGLSDKQVNINEELLNVLGESEKPNYILIMLISIIIIASVAIIYNIFYISVLERIRQFGMLRTIGAAPKHIRSIVLGEAMVLSIIAIPFGLLIGSILSKMLIGMVASLITIKLAQTVISFKNLLLASIIGILSVLISALSPAILASKVSPIEALRNDNKVINDNKIKRKKWHIAIQKLFGTNGEMAYRNLWRNKKKSIITIFSISLGVILYIVFGFYTNNLNQSNKLDNNILGDYKIVVENDSRYDIGYSEEIYNRIKRLNGVKEVLKTQYTNKIFTKYTEGTIPESLRGVFNVYKDHKNNVYNVSSNFFGYTDDGIKMFEKYLIEGKIDLNKMSKENIVLVTDSIRGLGSESQLKTGIKVGDEIVVRNMYKDDNGTISFGEEKKVVVGGILSNVPNYMTKTVLGLTIIAHQNLFKEISGNQTYQRLDIKVDKGVDKTLLNNNLKSIAQEVPQGTFVSLEEEIRKNEQDKRNIKLLGLILVAVIIFIGLINVVNTISTNLILRIREFGILRAVGISANRIKKTIMLEGMFYGLVSGIVGGAIGNVLVYILFILMKERMKLTYTFPWESTVFALIGSIVMGILSTILPLRRISSMNIIESIRVIE